MQLSIERSNLCLIEEQGDNLVHEFDLIEYLERSSMWQPPDCLGKLKKVLREFEHSIDLDWEFRLSPYCGARDRGRGRGSHAVAARFFFRCGTLIGLHFSRRVLLLVMRWMERYSDVLNEKRSGWATV
jgi:hypothetical protein